MENESLVQRDIEILKRAQTIGANPDFVLMFAACVFFLLVGFLCIGISSVPGWVLFGVIVAGVAADYFTGIGDKATLITLVIATLLLGLATLAVAGTVITGTGAG